MITQETLKQCVHYDELTGVFTRLRGVPHSPKGTILSGENAEGYIVFSVEGTRGKAHRWAILYMLGYLPTKEVDHKNRVRNDNRWSNLEEVTTAQNCQNRGKNCYTFSKGRTSPWRADITINGRRFQKSFRLEEDAKQYIKEIRDKWIIQN